MHTRSTTRSFTTAFTIAFACALVPLALAAQDATLPTYRGQGSVTQAIDTDQGAVLDIGSGITMTFPKGLPVGHSRLLTLSKSSKKPSAAQVHAGFVAIGPTLELNVPLNAGGTPLTLELTTKSDPQKRSGKLVLAMEIGTLCTAENKAYKLKNGLCSGWDLVSARYDEAGKRVVAELQSTGGMRMIFGVVPGDE